MAHIVRERDEVRARFEQVREERETVGGLRVEQLEQLGDLDDGGGADDADAEAFGDGELDAFRGAEVDVVDERFVAFGAEQRDADVGDGLR
jgi:hypothetical protein